LALHCGLAKIRQQATQTETDQIAHLQLACVSQARLANFFAHRLYLPAEFCIPSRAASAGLALPSCVPDVNVSCQQGFPLQLLWLVSLRLT